MCCVSAHLVETCTDSRNAMSLDRFLATAAAVNREDWNSSQFLINPGRWQSNTTIPQRMTIIDVMTGEKLRPRSSGSRPVLVQPEETPTRPTKTIRPQSGSLRPAYATAFMHRDTSRPATPVNVGQESSEDTRAAAYEAVAAFTDLVAASPIKIERPSPQQATFMSPSPVGNVKQQRMGAGSGDQFYRARANEGITKVHAPTRDDEDRQIPILLPHKLDWVQMAYTRTPPFQKAIEQREEAKRQERQRARKLRDVQRARWQQAKGTALARDAKAPTKLWGAVSDGIAASRSVPFLPQSPSSQLFRQADLHLNEHKQRLVELKKPEEVCDTLAAIGAAGLAAKVPAAGSQANLASRPLISRARSEALLDSRLSAFGAIKRWQDGGRGADADGKRSDRRSQYCFDRLSASFNK